MAKNPFEKFRSQVGSLFALNTKTIDGGVENERIKLTFDGQEVLNVDQVKTYVSDYVNIRKYRSIEIFVRSRINAKGHPSDVWVSGIVGNAEGTIRYYDWNNEDWTESYKGGGAVAVRPNKNLIQVVTSHPNFYWLKNLNGDRLRLRLAVSDELETNKNNTFEAWIVGELNV